MDILQLPLIETPAVRELALPMEEVATKTCAHLQCMLHDAQRPTTARWKALEAFQKQMALPASPLFFLSRGKAKRRGTIFFQVHSRTQLVTMVSIVSYYQ